MDHLHTNEAVCNGNTQSESSFPNKHESKDRGSGRNIYHKILKELISSRHSTRSFNDRAVPRSILEEAFELAQLAPSSLNIQPWQVIVVSGARLRRLKAAMHKAFSEKVPMSLPQNLEVFARYRSSFEDQLYFSEDGFNVPRDDKLSYMRAFTQNFDFYDAQTVAIIAINNKLGPLDAISVGLYLQTLVLLLTEKGLQSCFQGTITLWPDLVRKELGIENNIQLLCSLAIGYENQEQHMNQLKTQRCSWTENVKFVNE